MIVNHKFQCESDEHYGRFTRSTDNTSYYNKTLYCMSSSVWHTST